MRDRLIGLLLEAENKADENGFVNCNLKSRRKAGFVADHLLANGVIVAPYKPLPLVWPDDEFAQEVLCPICETDLMGCYVDGEEAPTVVTCYHCGAWLDSTKAVTREEAEAALAQREARR